MSVVVVATIHPLPGHRDEVLAALTDAIDATHAEDGCEVYALHEGPDRFVMIEKWESRAHLDAHLSGPVLVALGPRLDGHVSGAADIQVLEQVPSGTSKGAI